MAFVVVAKWTTREGEADKVEEAIRKLTPLSREEPGNLFYQAHRDPENPTATRRTATPSTSRSMASARRYRSSRAGSASST
jgi:heme-degrading monooxygenase HmoA